MQRVLLTILVTAFVLTPPEALAQGGRDRGGGGDNGDNGKIKSYDEVITDNAETKPGLFITHQIDDKLYYEVPTDALGLDMLWVTQIAETTAGASYAGMPAGDEVVRWEKQGDRVLLRKVSYALRASEDDPIAIAVNKSNLAPIIKVFDVEAYGKDKRPVIEVTDLFTSDVAEFSARRSLGAGGMDKGRTFLKSVKAFPENINVAVTATYNPGDNARGSSGVTAVIHHSMVKLPENPMTPRRHDDRVGFFSVGFTEFADNPDHEAERIRYITRWRLEKKDPQAELSEPKEPIVFYVAREVPEKWKPYVKAGIEQWQPAFEAAGFKNAIIGKYAPAPHEDPAWDPEDARISSIRWLPSNIANAFGPHVHDPRTGEILEADVRMYHNVQKLVRDWYFAQCAAVDERARDLPMPDDLMGELIQFVVAHEVGHSLGFPHNFKASSSYTVEQLRDPEWTKKNGTAPSIMDYARFNYVAQPGDGAALMPQIGPYDHFAVEWGYRQYDDEDAEQKALQALIDKQIDNPMYRFGGGRGDPSSQTEDLGADAIEATRLGLKNIDRIAAFLVQATCDEDEDYSLLDDMHGALIGQRNRELGHVANIVAGVEQRNFWYGDGEKRYFPVDGERQREAVAFLNEHAFRVPASLVSEDIIARLEASGVADRVLSSQQRILGQLVSDFRVKRMAELVERQPSTSYTPRELLADLRRGIFSELEESTANVNLYRRNLQRTYVKTLAEQVKSDDADTDLPALSRGALETLRGLIVRALDGDRNEVTVLHLRDMGARIEDALKGEREDAGTATASTDGRGRPGGAAD